MIVNFVSIPAVPLSGLTVPKLSLFDFTVIAYKFSSKLAVTVVAAVGLKVAFYDLESSNLPPLDEVQPLKV